MESNFDHLVKNIRQCDIFTFTQRGILGGSLPPSLVLPPLLPPPPPLLTLALSLSLLLNDPDINPNPLLTGLYNALGQRLQAFETIKRGTRLTQGRSGERVWEGGG
ncbi:hypothetical protein BJ165DRAFT_333438 [Panaeolus papilionaceus]|nr:hypothetical protein BJ165DRAFT_333438 [Panaeolus papilionaceus]